MEATPATAADKNKPLQVYMLNHCVFCVRKLSEAHNKPAEGNGSKRSRKQDLSKVIQDPLDSSWDKESNGPVPRFTGAFLSVEEGPKAFARIWRCLLQKRWMEGDSLPEVKFWMGKHFGQNVFWGYPAICIHCGSKLEELNKMIGDLIGKVKEIREIVKDKVREDRMTKLKGMLENYGDPEVNRKAVEKTMGFLRRIGEVGIEKEDDEPKNFGNVDKEASEEPEPTSLVVHKPKISFPPSQMPSASSLLVKSSEVSGGSSRRKSRLEVRHIPGETLVFMEGSLSEQSEMDEDASDTHADSDNQFGGGEAYSSAGEELSDNEDVKSEMEVKSESESESDYDEDVEEKPCISEETEDSNMAIDDPLGDTSLKPNASVSKSVGSKKKRRGRTSLSFERQMCDFCQIRYPHSEMLEHMKTHVGDYVAKCPNPTCSLVFSCPTRMVEVHKTLKRKCLDPLLVNGKMKKICDQCGFESLFLNQFLRHLNTFHETTTKNFSCPVANCKEQFTVRQSVELHIYKGHCKYYRAKLTEKVQKCLDCWRIFRPEEIEDHLRSAHKAEQIIACKLCPHRFSKWEHLVDHMSFHSSMGQDLVCDICDSTNQEPVKFAKLTELRDHYFKEHKIGSKFVCEICNKEFYTKEVLRQHQKQHHDPAGKRKDLKMFHCDICQQDNQFKSEATFTRHKILVHGEPPLCCRFCEKTFHGINLLIRHEKEHQGIKVKVTCTEPGCGKIFEDKTGLRLHLASAINHVGRTNNFVCHICATGFNTRDRLKRHMDVHKEICDHICEICGECFKSQKTLKVHRRIHTGDRPHECPICHQKFRQSGTLHRHRRSHLQRGNEFKPTGPMKKIRKRVEVKKKQ